MGLMELPCSREQVPAWIRNLDLSDNPYLVKLPNDLHSDLKNLYLQNNSALTSLPSYLPPGLLVHVGGSGLTPEYILHWHQRYPGSGVVFYDGDHLITPAREYRNPQSSHDRDRWVQTSARTAESETASESEDTSNSDERHGNMSSDEGSFEHGGLREGEEIVVTYSDDEVETDSSDGSKAGIMANPRNYGIEIDSDDDAALAEALEASKLQSADSGHTREHGDAATEEAGSARQLSDEDYAAHHVRLYPTIHTLAAKVVYWLSGSEFQYSEEQYSEALEIANSCVHFLNQAEIKEKKPTSLDDLTRIEISLAEEIPNLGQILDRFKDTASHENSSRKQREKIAGVLRAMVTDATLCTNCIVAIKVAATTCPDALATEGVDMLINACKAVRAEQEKWTPATYYDEARQLIRRDKTRAEVNKIIKRMKKDYRAELMTAIQKNHNALQSAFSLRGKWLSELVGERHKVKANGTIVVPDPETNYGEKALYKRTQEDRSEYTKVQANKRIDEIEVLSYVQNEMQKKGLLSDVQAGLYLFLHRENGFSDKLNVTSGELKTAGDTLRAVTEADIILWMTTWDPWTDFLDKGGYFDEINKDPTVLRLQEEQKGKMSKLQEDYLELYENYYKEPKTEEGEVEDPDWAIINNLINAVGTPIVSFNELRRRGGASADAMTNEDKENHIKQANDRLQVLIEEAAEQARAEAASTSNASRSDRQRRRTSASAGDSTNASSRQDDRHRHRHTRSSRQSRQSTNGQSSRESGNSRAERVVEETPPKPKVSFEQAKVDLLKDVLKELKAIGEPPIKAALLRKTRELVRLGQMERSGAELTRRIGSSQSVRRQRTR